MKTWILIIIITLSFGIVHGQEGSDTTYKSENEPPKGSSQYVITTPPDPLNLAQYEASLWPNPSLENFNIKVDSPSDNEIKVYITDFIGRAVSEFNGINRTTLSFGDDFAPGIYFVRVKQDDEFRSTFKIIKQ